MKRIFWWVVHLFVCPEPLWVRAARPEWGYDWTCDLCGRRHVRRAATIRYDDATGRRSVIPWKEAP